MLVPGNLYKITRGYWEDSSSVEFIEENYKKGTFGKELRLEVGKIVMFLERKYVAEIGEKHLIFLVYGKRTLINYYEIERRFFDHFIDVTPKE
jgi:hypothetical protein